MKRGIFMKTVNLICPKCGGELSNVILKNGRTDTFCQYCGNHIWLEDENHQVITHRTVDEARVKREEAKLKRLEMQQEALRMAHEQNMDPVKRRQNLIMVVVCLALLVGLMFFCLHMAKLEKQGLIIHYQQPVSAAAVHANC